MLTDKQVKGAKTRARPYKLTDQAGLYLHVSKSGTKSWRYDYRLAGRRHTLTIGQYPLIPLKEARELHTDARRVVAKGISPALAKQREKRAAKLAAANSFRDIAEQWIEAHAPERSRGWRTLAEAWMKNDVYPLIGERPIKDVGPADVLAAMRRLEERGARTSAERLRSMLSQIFRYAVRNLRADIDPAHAVKGAVTVPETKHHPTFKLDDLPAFLEKVEAYPGRRETHLGMRLLLITFVRKTELANAEWSEIDLDAAEWRIPAERMKMKEEHVVPLSTQSVEIFEELRVLSRKSQFVFPNRNDPRRPMGPSRFNDMIRALGYTGTFSPHGVRSLASTALNEQGWRSDAIERQLAHAERSKVRAAYNRAEYLDERREMMQQWADMVDAVAQGDCIQQEVTQRISAARHRALPEQCAEQTAETSVRDSLDQRDRIDEVSSVSGSLSGFAL